MRYALALILVAAFVHQSYATQGDAQKTTQSWLEVTVNTNSFNDTLHSQYLKYRVLRLAGFLANVGYYTLTGGVLDFNKRSFIYFDQPTSAQIRLKQAHKLKKMGQALLRTRDDDFKLAGNELIVLADALIQEDRKEAKRHLMRFIDFWVVDIKPGELQDRDAEILQGISQSIVSEFKNAFGALVSSVQSTAVKSLNLNSILGGSL